VLRLESDQQGDGDLPAAADRVEPEFDRRDDGKAAHGGDRRLGQKLVERAARQNPERTGDFRPQLLVSRGIGPGVAQVHVDLLDGATLGEPRRNPLVTVRILRLRPPIGLRRHRRARAGQTERNDGQGSRRDSTRPGQAAHLPRPVWRSCAVLWHDPQPSGVFLTSSGCGARWQNWQRWVAPCSDRWHTAHGTPMCSDRLARSVAAASL
jgi:hypothetical protein